MDLTGVGLSGIIVIMIAQIMMKWLETRKEKKKAADPEVKRKLEEAEELKAEKLRKKLIADVEGVVEIVVKRVLADHETRSSGLHVDLSKSVEILEKVLAMTQESLNLDREMHKWHDVDVPLQPGTKIWYSPIKELRETTAVLKGLNETMQTRMAQDKALERALDQLITAMIGRHQD